MLNRIKNRIKTLKCTIAERRFRRAEKRVAKQIDAAMSGENLNNLYFSEILITSKELEEMQ